MTDSESNVYRERAHLVANLASRYPAVIATTDEPDWPVIYIDTPTGQLSWHLAVADLDLFDHVTRVPASDPRARWDGHTTAEKYDRLDALTLRAPGLGDTVLYRSKIDNGPGNDVISPATVLRTRSTTIAAVADRWTTEPRTVTSATSPAITHTTTARPAAFTAELPDDTTVDLLVHGLGQDYREYNVPIGQTPGTWHWPTERSNPNV